jgi:vacuolar-type H+-ATPase subunit H
MGVELMVASAVLGAAGGIAGMKQAGKEAQAIVNETEFEAREREKETQKTLGGQTMSFLKSGVTLEGTPSAVLEETKTIGEQDAAAIRKFGRTKAKNVKRKARDEMFQGVVSSVGNIAGGL